MSDSNGAPAAAQPAQSVSPPDAGKETVTSASAAKVEPGGAVNKPTQAAVPAPADPMKIEPSDGAAKASDDATREDAASPKKTRDADAPKQEADVKAGTEEDSKAGAGGAAEGPGSAPGADGAAAPATPASKQPHRKSIGGSEAKGKKLNRKQSKGKITHLDAKPGDYFFVKLKGWPQWPAIIADEDMLPETIIRSRPVTAANEQGVYRQDFADGGKKVADRTFPVMYMGTNEFGWVPNTDLIDFDVEEVRAMKRSKMRKDLANAHDVALAQNSLAHFKEVLIKFQEDLITKQQEDDAKAASKAASKKARLSQAAAAEDGDVDMPDAAGEADQEVAEKKKSKKRKADEDDASTPQRSDSVKKPKIKVISSATPKSTNGTPSTKATKAASESKPAKAKAKKSEEKKEAAVPKEPELSAEEKHARKEKEVLFLRHKLQKGLLTRDQEPKEDEMKLMSDYITKLEGFPDLEVSIIRATKINKVLKAILKLDSIPKEDDFHFKPRSQALLDKWNKLLAVDGPVPMPGAEPATAVNGTQANGSDAAPAKEAVKEPEKTKGPAEAKSANGVKGEASPSAAVAKSESKSKDAPHASEAKNGAPADKAPKEEPPVSEAVETSA